MEGTDTNASTKRKRRSSILKSQRAPRTPFSELEFNVATPTDTAKSRRVSFSRRTGVAEFVTNEATTTWKNFYEEQNRSLESSGRDSSGAGRAPGPGHLGNRLFDQQFQEVEADNIEFGSFVGPTQGQFNQSLNVNVTEQLALLETTADERKLTVPSHRFEISEVTDHGKLFKDDLTNPTNTELTNLQINFSTLQPATQDDNDDLDAIERDLECSQPNVVCPGPFSNRGDVSQYIEFDLNMTQGPLRCSNESDMSITETIQSPKKELSNLDVNKPVESWVENKENIVVNPYVAPDEGDNFAIRASPEKVLVFDGKKLKYESVDTDLDELVDARNSLSIRSLNSRSFEGKKVVYADLDSPEGSGTNLAPNRTARTNKTLLYSDNVDLCANMSMTGVINVADIKNHTKVYDLDDGEMSMTKCVAKTQNLNEEVDLVVTRALKNMVKESLELVAEPKFCEQNTLKDIVEAEAKSSVKGESKKKRETIVFRDNEGDISMTACVPNEVLAGLVNKTEASFDMSMTKAIPNNLIESLPRGNFDEAEIASVNMTRPEIGPIDKTASLGFEITKTEGLNISGNMSMTKVLPNKIITNFVTENKLGDEIDVSSVNMSMTKPVPNNIVATYAAQDSKTEEMEISDVNMSMTKVIPNEIIKHVLAEDKIAEKENFCAASATKLPVENCFTNEMDTSDVNMSITKAIPHDLLAKLSTDYEIPRKDSLKPDADVSTVNMSTTKAIPTNAILNLATKTDKLEETEGLVSKSRRRKTIIFQDADISMTQAIPVNVIEEIREKTVISSTSLLSDLTSEHVSYVQSNKKTVDIHERSARSVSTERCAKKTIYSEETTVDVSNQTLAVSRNITKIISRQMSPEFQRSKSPKLLEAHKPSVTESRIARSRSPKSPMTSPNKSYTQPSRYSFGKRSNSSRSTSPDRDNKLLNLDKFGEKKRRSHSPEYHNTSRNTSLGKSRQSHGRSVNPFSNPSKATSPDEPSVPKKTVKPYQIHNKAISPEKLDFGVLNQSHREVLVYQAVAPVNPKDKTSGSSTCGETTTTSSSTESLTTSTDHYTSSTKTTTASSDNQDSAADMDKTRHSHNQSIAVAIESEISDSKRKKAPSSKGDEFQKSSQKLYGQPGITKLINPQLERRKTSPSKGETEVPINTIAYDQLDNISKKSVKTSLVYTEHGCQPDAVSTPELVSETTSFHISQKKSESKDISLTAVATTRETSCDPMSREFVLEQPKLRCKALNEDIGLDPPSADAILLKRSPPPLICRITETGTQRTPSDKSLRSYVKSGRTVFTALQSSTSNESCKTLTDDMTSEDEPYKPSETSTRTLLNNLLDMSDVSLPTNCAAIGQSNFKAGHFDKTVCDVTSSAKARLSPLNGDRKCEESSMRHSPLKSIIADVKKRITFNENAKERTYEPPTDSDTYDSRDGLVQSGLNRNPSAEQSDSTVSDEKPSKLLDIISILTHPDADVLTSTSSEDPGSAKKIKFNLATDTEDTSQVSIVNDGKFIHVHDTSSQDTDMTALTKPAYSFSDHSNNKGNVIPSRYYDDVAENVNDLMKDLIKPRSDGYPFEDVPFPLKPNKSPSICSTQVQATLATSSQVDLDVLPYESMYELSHVCQENVPAEKRLKSIIKPRNSGENLNTDIEDEYESVTLKLQRHRCDRHDDRVLVFDRENPLNNVMIAPIDFKEAHEYHPESEVETSETEENNMAVNSVRIQPRSPSLNSEVQPQSEERNASMKDTEVNTIVAMKGTKELLDANSSLTLVEEQVVRRSTDTDLLGQKKKRLQVLFKSSREDQEGHLEKTFLGNIVPDVIPEPKSPNKSKITSWLQEKSPRKSPQRSPRSPTINIPKCSLSPKIKHGTSPKTSQEERKQKKKRRSSPITVQQLVTQIGDPTDTDLMNQQLLRAMQDNLPLTSSESDIGSQKNSLPKSVEMLNSSTSSNSSSIKHSGSGRRRSDASVLKDVTSKSDWQPELLNDVSSKNLIADCESSTNVVAQIAMLPFMGSRECEWESSNSDSWSFRLLHGRLRLTVQLAHRLGNAPRRLVRADTPVKAVCLEPIDHEKRDTVASLCVRYAAEATLVRVSRGCARAASVPALLARAAAVARVALRWGAAMYDAKLRLAFTIRDNIIALKVANIPLRSVWEVTLRIDMCGAGQPDAPWPAACDVTVTPVVTDWDITPQDVERALAGVKRDWGHVPKTLWKIFRFLKNKTRDEDVLKYVH